MDRRRFLLTLLVGTVAAPLGAEAQPPTKAPRIAYLFFNRIPESDIAGSNPRDRYAKAFVDAMRETPRASQMRQPSQTIPIVMAGGASDEALKAA